MTFYKVYTEEYMGAFWLLHSVNDKLHVQMRAEYQEFVCPKCKKMNTLRALERGISSEVYCPASSPDMLETHDGVRVISQRGRTVFERIPGAELRYFPFPSSEDRFAIFPTRMFFPPPDARTYTYAEPRDKSEPFQLIGGPCRKCKRFREVTFQSDRYHVPNDVVVAGVGLEQPRRDSVVWIASERVVDELTAAGVTGMLINKQRPIRGID